MSRLTKIVDDELDENLLVQDTNEFHYKVTIEVLADSFNLEIF